VHAYKPGFSHRHAPEIEQEASGVAGTPVRVSFVPHLLPTIRGIATSVYVRPKPGASAAAARATLEIAYGGERFVRVLPEGAQPSLRDVRGSNFCDIAFVEDARNDTWILLSTLDNLGKGASGQAVQCANLMCGFAEETGLLEAPWVP
jgi:N-acetyl-gamma-glutamyl-phosphate reductase